jgi:hypothetical protein
MENNNLTPINITVFLGLKQSGKTYRAKKIPNAIDLNFADALKEIAGYTLTSDSNIFFRDDRGYAAFKNSTIGNTSISGRVFLQRLGTSIREIDPDFFVKAWVDAANNTLLQGTYKNITCSDARFENEIDAIFDKFFGRVEFIFCDYRSTNYDSSDKHESELLAHKLKEIGFVDGQKLSYSDIKKAFELIEGEQI